MRRMALVARMKLPSNMAAPGIEPGSRGYEPRMLTTRLRPQALWRCGVTASFGVFFHEAPWCIRAQSILVEFLTLLFILLLQINARTELALRYNDISPLENHHCAKAFEILGRVNFLNTLTAEQFKKFREGMIK